MWATGYDRENIVRAQMRIAITARCGRVMRTRRLNTS
jgi:hypothetical protein